MGRTNARDLRIKFVGSAKGVLPLTQSDSIKFRKMIIVATLAVYLTATLVMTTSVVAEKPEVGGMPALQTDSPSRPAKPASLPQGKDKKSEKILLRLTEYLSPLSYPRGDRWPVVYWGRVPPCDTWKALLDRGLMPLCVGSDLGSKVRIYSKVVQFLQFAQSRGMPIVILPQGWVQPIFKKAKRPDCNHLPPAKSQSVNRDFACPAWMYEAPGLDRQIGAARRLCNTLKAAQIHPDAIWIDFETGAYLRNGAEHISRLRPAMEEAQQCPRCVERFGVEALQSPVAYRDLVDKARAHVIRRTFADVVESVFPRCRVGNYFAYPVRRHAAGPGQYPAYGWDGSGMTIAQPRSYVIPGWHNGSTQKEVDWNIFRTCVERISVCAEVLGPDEIMVPWFGYLWGNSRSVANARMGRPIASGKALREMVYHAMLRGAETISVFTNDIEIDSLEAMRPVDPDGLGPFLLNVKDIQAGYDQMLRFHEHLRSGRVLNYDIGGIPNRLDHTTALWSGVANSERALIRTVTFGPEEKKVVRLFDRWVTLPFAREGGFFWVSNRGRVAPIDTAEQN